MRHYITWEEFTTKYPRKEQYDCDEYSKYIIKTYVERYTGCTCTYFSTSKEDSSLDFKMVNKNGKTFLCEIKDRWDYKSTDFTDHMFEVSKLKGLVARKNNGEGDAMSLFSIYKDGVIKITANLEKNCMGTTNNKAPQTTALSDHNYVDKDFVLFKSDIKVFFCIGLEEDITGRKIYFPVFSDNKIDIQKLNFNEQNVQNKLF